MVFLKKKNINSIDNDSKLKNDFEKMQDNIRRTFLRTESKKLLSDFTKDFVSSKNDNFTEENEKDLNRKYNDQVVRITNSKHFMFYENKPNSDIYEFVLLLKKLEIERPINWRIKYYQEMKKCFTNGECI